LLHISEAQRKCLLDLQQRLTDNYMQFAHGFEAPGEVPSLGEDFSAAYGYAREHHTVELWLRLWCAYTKDVREKGTPRPVEKFVDLLTHIWNKLMGFVDTIRKVLMGVRVAKRGPNTKPGSMLWYSNFDYVLYNAFRTFQYALLEEKMDSFTSYQAMQKARQSTTFKDYCYGLSNVAELHTDSMAKFFPGLRDMIDRDGLPTPALQPLQPVTTDLVDGATGPQGTLPVKYNITALLLDRTSPFNLRRLANRDKHALIATSKVCRCILCCRECSYSKEQDVTPKKHYRLGYQTTKKCNICNVFLCKRCFAPFHEQSRPSLPLCSSVVLPGPATRVRQRQETSARKSNKKQRGPPPPPPV